MNKENLLDFFDQYKIIVFIPQKDAEAFIRDLSDMQVNQLGQYINCISWGRVISTWTPLEGAKPYIGSVGQKSVENEVRLEFICRREPLRSVIEYIKNIHPYETPEIDILPAIDFNSLL